MNPETNAEKDLKPKNVLFSWGCYNAPIWPFDSDRPSYNPSINAIYIPPIENELGALLAIAHEYSHHALLGNPALCFLQILSNFIYYEMTCPTHRGDPDISAIFPTNNPLIRILKALYETVLKQTAYIQEADALFRTDVDLHAYLHFEKYDTEGWIPQEKFVAQKKAISRITERERAIAREEAKLPGFKHICNRYLRLKDNLDSTHTYGYLTDFPLMGPIFFPKLPVTAEGLLDSSQITDEVADEAIAKFNRVYDELPYSIPKRFLSVISSFEKMIDENFQFEETSIRKRLQELNNFDQAPLSVHECYHCPVDALHSQGISIPYNDFGAPDGYFTTNTPKRFNCGRRMPALRGHFDPLNAVYMKFVLGKIDRSMGYIAHWPLSSFLTASECLKDLVFNRSRYDQIPSRITLIEKIRFPDDRDLNLLPGHPGLNFSKNFSPFISVESVGIDSDEEPALDIPEIEGLISSKKGLPRC